MVVVMHMQKRTKQALQFSGAILAMASIVTVTLGAVPRETLLDWGRKAALFSAGIQQPEGGAVALSERLERQPAQGQEKPGQTGASSSGSATTQPPPSAAEQDPHVDVMGSLHRPAAQRRLGRQDRRAAFEHRVGFRGRRGHTQQERQIHRRSRPIGD